MRTYPVCTLSKLRDGDTPGEYWVDLGALDDEYHMVRRVESDQCRIMRPQFIVLEGFSRDIQLDEDTEEIAHEPRRGRTPGTPGDAPSAGFSDW